MAAVASLIPELEDIVQRGSVERRTEALSRITNLFLTDAERLNDDHVRLFDDVFGHLITEIETKTRAELSRRLAPVGNAPLEIVRRLARDKDIAVAGPVLTQSPRLTDTDLVPIAQSGGQAHLIAISGRAQLGEAVTEILVERGNPEVARKVADNPGAKFSDASFSVLVGRAEKDGVLAEKIGQRQDIPPHLFRELLIRATEVVQKKLLAAAKPETQSEIRRVLAKVSEELAGQASRPRDYTQALDAVRALKKEGKLDEAQLGEFARNGQYEQTVASLSELCGVPIAVIDRLMEGERPDPVLILCKSSGFGWPTARMIMTARPGRRGTSSAGLDAAAANFDRLSPVTAQRVVRFWQVGHGDAASR
ncbi:MAG: DUF2336 domain-containing protein [Pseudorhodoplanes sp.]